jgi:hypothetical protein
MASSSDKEGLMKTVLYLTSPTCGKCKIVDKWWNDFVAEHSGYNFSVVDTSLSLEEARRYGVQQLPGFVVLDDKEKYLGKLVGSPAAGDLDRLLMKFK